MVGGTVGILYCPYMVITNGLRLDVLIIISIFLLIYVTSLAAGIYLWKGTKFGRMASIGIQFLQLVKVMSPAVTFTFSFGFDAYPHLSLIDDYSMAGFQIRFLADSQLFFGSEGSPYLLGISIPAAIALITLRNFDPDSANPPTSIGQMPPSPDKYNDLISN